jgi:hypothetical protein
MVDNLTQHRCHLTDRPPFRQLWSVKRNEALRSARLRDKGIYSREQIAPCLAQIAARPSRKQHLTQPSAVLAENRHHCLDPLMELLKFASREIAPSALDP